MKMMIIVHECKWMYTCDGKIDYRKSIHILANTKKHSLKLTSFVNDSMTMAGVGLDIDMVYTNEKFCTCRMDDACHQSMILILFWKLGDNSTIDRYEILTQKFT